MAVKLVSMKRSAKDKRKDMGNPAEVTSIAPDYPWGLCLNMDSDELDKLGLNDLPDVGAEYTLTAKVLVTSVSQSASQRSGAQAEEQRGITLQVTDMALEPGKGTA